MKEDKLTNKLIEKNTFERQEQLINSKGEEAGTAKTERKAIPEVHYNHYGTRGVVDLLIREETQKKFGQELRDHIIEVKANPKNANKVIRQFNRMREYFYKGSKYQKPQSNKSSLHNVIFELCFTAEEKNLEHVKKNLEMYKSLFAEDDKIKILFRHPEKTSPVPAFGETFDIGDELFWQVADTNGIFQEVKR